VGNKVIVVIGRDKSYFFKSHSKSNNKYKQDFLIQVLDFLIDNPVWWTGVSKNDRYYNVYELCSAICFYMLMMKTSFKGFSRIQLAQSFNSSFCYIDDVLLLNNSL